MTARYLMTILEALRRQREALIGSDVAAVRQLYGQLGELFAGLQTELDAAQRAGDSHNAAEIASLAGRVRNEMRVNAALLSNGVQAADHLVRSVARTCTPGQAFAFSGLA